MMPDNILQSCNVSRSSHWNMPWKVSPSLILQETIPNFNSYPYPFFSCVVSQHPLYPTLRTHVMRYVRNSKTEREWKIIPSGVLLWTNRCRHIFIYMYIYIYICIYIVYRMVLGYQTNVPDHKMLTESRSWNTFVNHHRQQWQHWKMRHNKNIMIVIM